MRFYVFPLAFICALAIGSITERKTFADGTDPNKVVGQPVYDLGVVSPSDKEEKEEAVVAMAPKGKADKLVVVSTPRCGGCIVLKPILEALKKQGYKIEVYDALDSEDRAKLEEKYSNIKQGNSKKVNYWYAMPTIFYVRGDSIIKRDVGAKSAVHIRKTLWKESDKPTAPIVKNLNQIRGKFPWNR